MTTLTAAAKPVPLLLRPFALLGRKIFANPVLHIELRRWMRGRRPVMLVTTYLVLLFLVGTVGMSNFAMRSHYGSPQQLSDLGRTLMTSVVTLLFFAILIVTPGLTAAAIPRERENQTLGFLRMTLLTPGEIILGKFLVALCFCAILLVLTMPFLATAFLTGGISPGELAYICGSIMLLAAFVAALNLVIGVDLKKSAIAFIIAYIAGFSVISPAFGIISTTFFVSGSMPLASLFGVAGNRSTELLLIFSLLAACLLTATLLMLAVARERLAGWRERAAYLRAALLGGLILPQAALLGGFAWFVAQQGIVPQSPAALQMATVLVAYTLIYVFFTIMLLGLRRPHAEQFSQPFPLAFLRAHSPAALVREDVLGFPFFLVVLLIAGMVLPAGALAWSSGTAHLFIPLAATVYGAVQIIFWCGCALALAVALLPRHLVNLGTVLMLAILFLTSVCDSLTPVVRRLAPALAMFDLDLLSPFAYFAELFDYAGQSGYNPGGKLLFNTAVVVHVYLLAAIIPWSALALGWYIRRKRALTGNDDDM